MKKRNISYFKKIKAMKVLQRPMETDLMTFLGATFQLCRSKVVKRHVENQIRSLQENWYRMSA